MFKVKAVAKVVDVEATSKSGKAVFKDTIYNTVVASTKSFNNFKDDLANMGKIVASADKVEFFLDMEATEKAVIGLVKSQNVESAYLDMTVRHIMKALDTACCFEREKASK